MWEIEQRGVVFDATRQPPSGRIACFTSLCLLADGSILCAFQNGPGKHAVTSVIRLCRSRDGGREWELLPAEFTTTIDGVPGSLAAAEIVEASPGKLVLLATWFDRSDPGRPLFDPVTEGILKSKQLLCVSTDQGDRWSDWREVSVGELTGCALTGPLTRWENGEIAVAFESFKQYDDPAPGRHAAWLMLSRDGCESFEEPLLLAQHPEHRLYYWDQRICAAREPGEFIAMFWTHDLVERRDRNVHLRTGAARGKTLALNPILATSITGQIAAPLALDDNRLLAFVVDRASPGTMMLWHSADNGQSWPAEHRLVVYSHNERAALSQGLENIDFKQYWEDMGKWSFGHPALRQLPDGALLLAWYAGSPDCMSIHWARVLFTPAAEESPK